MPRRRLRHPGQQSTFVSNGYETMIKQAKRKALEAKGWKFGSAKDFLGLSPDEVKYIELKLALSAKLKAERKRRRLSQKAVADRVKSSQSRVAKMEAGDPTVSLDLLVKSLFALGATKKDLAKVIARSTRAMA